MSLSKVGDLVSAVLLSPQRCSVLSDVRVGLRGSVLASKRGWDGKQNRGAHPAASILIMGYSDLNQASGNSDFINISLKAVIQSIRVESWILFFTTYESYVHIV